MKNRTRGTVVFLATVLAVTTLFSLPTIDHFHDLDIDLLHWLRAKLATTDIKSVDPPAVVVAIDEVTHASPPFKGIPKVMWTPQIAEVQTAVLKGGAKVFGWDIILPTSASAYLNNRRFDQALLKSFISERRSGRIVLGQAQLNTQIIAPHRAFAMTAGGQANIRNLDISVDDDGVSRSLPMFIEMTTKSGTKVEVPGMAMELAARAVAEKPQLTSKGVQFMGRSIPGGGMRELALNFDSRVGAIPTYSFVDLYKCAKAGKIEYFERAFSGKVVLFGLVLDIEDRKLSSNRLINRPDFDGAPLPCVGPPSNRKKSINRSTVPGVYLHATAVNNLLNAASLKLPDQLSRIVASLLLAILGSLLTLMLKPVSTLIGLMLFGGLWASLATWLMRDATVLPLIEPLAAMILSSVVLLSYRFIIADKDKRYLRQEFSSYVSPNLVEAIIDSPDRSAVTARHQECSFVFTDLANFTTTVESLDPEVLRTLMNEYIDGMVQIVFEHDGTLDKVIGDALCIFFSAPIVQADHAQRAVDCALELDAWSRDYVSRMNEKGILIGKTRIGVNSGQVVVGNFGGSTMFDYTAYGDAVNTAARLESINKQLGTNICVSGKTIEKCKIFVGRPVGNLVLKGKSEKTEAYQPLSEMELQSPAIEAYLEAYGLMESADPNAEAAFAKAAADFPTDPLIKFHYQRLKNGESGNTIVMSEK